MNDKTDNKGLVTPDDGVPTKDNFDPIDRKGPDTTTDRLPFLTEQEKTALRNAGMPIDHPMIEDMLRKCPD